MHSERYRLLAEGWAAFREKMALMWLSLLGISRAVFLLVIALNGAVGQASQTQQAAKPSQTVYFTAQAKDGSSVVLDARELSVSIDKQPSPIGVMRSSKEDPLLFAVLVDVSNSDAASANAIRQVTLQLFQGLGNGRNHGYLVLFNQGVAISKQPLATSQAKQAVEEVKFTGGTAVYDAIEQTCRRTLNRLANPDNPRRVIILISDGADNQSHVPYTKAEEVAQEEGVPVFSLAPQAEPRGERFLKEVSESTGGRYINNNLQQVVPIVLSAIDAQWLVSFTPSQPGGGKLHSVRVKSTQKHVEISAPANIFLP